MIKSILKYCAILFAVMFLVGSTQYVMLDFLFPGKYDANVIPKVYLLWILLSIFGFAPVFWFKKKNPQNMGMVYLVTSILKMFGSLILLLPILLNPNEENTFFSLNFVVAFFIILLFELLYFIRMQKSMEKKAT